ncbi:hypothetical protein ACOMHN_033561 [Nucella lapillus]
MCAVGEPISKGEHWRTSVAKNALTSKSLQACRVSRGGYHTEVKVHGCSSTAMTSAPDGSTTEPSCPSITIDIESSVFSTSPSPPRLRHLFPCLTA